MKPRTYWVLMKLVDWDAITVNGQRVTPPSEGPDQFISVFKTKKRAVSFNRGRKDKIFKIVEVLP